MSKKDKDKSTPPKKATLTLDMVMEFLGTEAQADEALKIANKRALAAEAEAREAESREKIQASETRSAESKAKYATAQAEKAESERITAEELRLKAEQEVADEEEAKRDAAVKLEQEKAVKHEAAAAADARAAAGEYEPLNGEKYGGVYLERSALNIKGVGAILRIVPLDKEGGAPCGIPQHLFIPNSKPSEGILKRSVR